MLRSVKDLMGYLVVTLEGEIGRVRDFYFDSKDWMIRYMVVELGGAGGKKVLIPPADLIDRPDWESRSFGLNVSMQTALNSPAIDTERPVTRWHEKKALSYFSRPFYWTASPFGGPGMPGIVEEDGKGEYEGAPSEQDNGDHLHSAGDMMGYEAFFRDGKGGRLYDFIADDNSWRIRYSAVEDSSGIIEKKKYLLNPEWIEDVDHMNCSVAFKFGKKEMRANPEYDPEQPVNMGFEERLYDYLGRPR